MAKHQALSKHQKAIVRRYYENRETAALQKLGEAVSELYLADSPKKADRLWERVKNELLAAGENEIVVAKLLIDRDIERLARIVERLS